VAHDHFSRRPEFARHRGGNTPEARRGGRFRRVALQRPQPGMGITDAVLDDPGLREVDLPISGE